MEVAMRYFFLYFLFFLFAFGNLQSQFLTYKLSEFQTDTLIQGIGTFATKTVESKPSLWISPSVNVDFFIYEAITEQSAIGISPGAGYGIRWRPKWFYDFAGDTFDCFLAIDFYAQMNLSKDASGNSDFFNIDILPSLTVIDWISIGFGHRWKVKQKAELKSYDTNILSIGIRKSL